MPVSGAGPWTAQPMYPLIPVSPVELMYVLMNRDLNPDVVPGGCTVESAENTAQQTGVVVIAPNGRTQVNPHMPVIFQRIQVRCIGHSVSHSEQIAYHVTDVFDTRHRELVTQPSTNNTWLVHRIQLLAGPSGHWDTPTTWEMLMFFGMDVGRVPVS